MKINSRNDFADLPWLVGLELGVSAGAFSRQLLCPKVGRHWRHVTSIDRWSDHHDMSEYLKAMELLSEFGTCSTVIRASFSEALPCFEDSHFDFIYIDGYAHTGQDGGATLRDWWPKLAPGGVFAGHDYDPEFPLTIEAVDDFAADKGLEINITPIASPSIAPFPSWYMFKDAPE